MISFFKTVGNRLAAIDEITDHSWINLTDPTEAEIAYVMEELNLEPDFVRAALDEEESSRIEVDEGNALVIIDIPQVETEGEAVIYSTMPIGIILTDKNIVTVCLKENNIIREFAAGAVKQVRTEHKTQFLLYLLFTVANRFLQYLKQIDKISAHVEKKLHKSMKNSELIQLLDLEKSLVFFSTSLKSNEITLEKILRGRLIKLYDEDQELLEDVLIEIKQAIEMSNIYSSILSGTMDAFASVISNNLNIVMKVLTSMSIILTIPTVISSFYGMNVSGMPVPAFWFPLVLSLGLAGAAAFILSKKGLL